VKGDNIMKPLLSYITLIFVFCSTVAYAGGITVYEPAKNTRWTAGKTYTIKWRFEEEFANPLIELFDPISKNKVGTIVKPTSADVSDCGNDMYCQSWKIPSNMNQSVRVIKVTIGSATGFSQTFRIVKQLKLKTVPKVKIDLTN
jgi:hypothetical protein